MFQVWKSDDGHKEGTEEEVRQYEEGLKSPLAEMRFPYVTSGNKIIGMSAHALPGDWQKVTTPAEFNTLIAAANLMPLIEEFYTAWTELRPDWKDYELVHDEARATKSLFVEYEKVREMARSL